jgi:hypothetical protein
VREGRRAVLSRWWRWRSYPVGGVGGSCPVGASGTLVKTIGVTSQVHDHEFSPHGGLLAVVGQEADVSLWTVPGLRPWAELTQPAPSAPAGGLSLIVNRVAFGRGGRILVAVNSDGVAQVWDLRPADEVRELCQAPARAQPRPPVAAADLRAQSMPGRLREAREAVISVLQAASKSALLTATPGRGAADIHTQLTRNSRGIVTPTADNGARRNSRVPTVRCADVDEQEHPAGAEPTGASAPGAIPPVTEPAVARPERRRRGEGARKALSSRGAGWVVAAVLAGAVVALSVVLATASSTSVLQPVGAARSFRFVTAGGRTMIVPLPPSARVEVPANAPPGASWVQVPANAPLRTSWVEVPAGAQPGNVTIVGPAGAPPGALRIQVPAGARPGSVTIVGPAGGNAPGRWVEIPARVWIQVPARVVAPAPAASPKSTAH